MRFVQSFAKQHSYLFAVACIVTASAAFVPGRSYFAKSQWALLYLLIVVLVAGTSGVRPALLAAALAFLCWNFLFLPPYDTFVVHDPKDWLALLVFLAVGLAMGMQTGRLREREAEAIARGRETAMLNQFSARLVSDASVNDVADLLISEVTQITGAESAALFLADDTSGLDLLGTGSEGHGPLDPSVAQIAGWAYAQSKAVGLPDLRRRSDPPSSGWPICADYAQAGGDARRGDLFVPLQTSGRQEGVVYVGPRADRRPYTVAEARPILAAANQTAAFLERKRLQSEAVQAGALREASRLKSTLISSVSHELKTPIASLVATVSNLAQKDVEWDNEKTSLELASMQDDLDRLAGSINALLDLSRLESADWEPRMEWYDAADLLWAAEARVPQKQRHRVHVHVPDVLPMLCIDLAQMTRALENVLLNALTYSPPESEVKLGACVESGEFRLCVEDRGPGIPPEERDKVFEKFYRGRASSKCASGTGLGLAVTREIVRFHSGRVLVEDAVPHGTRVVISLPCDEGERPV